MGTPFHRNVPSWMIRYLAQAKCSKCNGPIRKAHITAIGVRGQDDQTVPYVEYQCPCCNHRAMKSFGGQVKGTIEEICYMLLEEFQNKKRIRQSQSVQERSGPHSDMTDDEIKKFLDNMSKFETYVDLLKEIGATEWLEPDCDED